jgi:ABC-type transport system substrate-binding protein
MTDQNYWQRLNRSKLSRRSMLSAIPNGELMGDDPELQGLLDQQLQATDIEERRQLVRDIQVLLANEMYLIPEVSVTYTLFAQPRIKNANMVSVFAPMHTLENIWVEDA